MRNRGPIITLFAVAALAVVLLAMNMTTVRQTASQATGTPPPQSAPALADPPARDEAPTDPSLADPPEADSSEADPSEAEADPSLADPSEADPSAIASPPDAAPEQVTYAGRTSGNEATIAIAVRDGETAAYLCDGRRVEAWLEGTNTDGELTLEGADGASATGTVEGDAVFGTVLVDGEQLPYSAQLASSPAGLYQGTGTVNGTPTRIGWIVLPDGSQVGIRNANGIREPAPALDLRTLGGVTVDGSRIEPQRVAGDTQVVGISGGPPA